MKIVRSTKLFLVALAAFALLAVGCSRVETSSGDKQADGVANMGDVRPIEAPASDATTAFKAELRTEPSEVKAGERAKFIFIVRDAQGKQVRNLSVVHEKPMHLLIVSNDLNEFYHVHPEPQADGTYRVEHIFPNGGAYKLFADFTPNGGSQVVDRLNLSVAGTTRAAVALVEDKSTTKTVDNLRVTMKPDNTLRAGSEVMLNFAVADQKTGKPVTDLQPYLGALAHFVIISEDGTDFLHAHPMEKTEAIANQGGGDHNAMSHAHGNEGQSSNSASQATASEVAAHTSFPRAGLYKVWAQFQRGGRVTTVPFVVRVAAGGERTGNAAANNPPQPIPADAIRVRVSGSGYEPSRIEVKKGQTTKIAFYRADANNCGGTVVFPALNIRRELPVGKTVVVEVTPTESGELAFACGMNMYRGALVVQ
ncbi:MAG: cupredoxin domain-containing protein [Pyrinomonadaceae bacterium]|nr:cupredoxin domain-containing protein [Pyrinomonadaceae bacterium]